MPLDDPLDLEADDRAHKDRIEQASGIIDQLEDSRSSWKKLEATAWGRQILQDLQGFTRGGSSPLRESDRETFVAIGRLETWLFVCERLAMSEVAMLRMIDRSTQ